MAGDPGSAVARVGELTDGTMKPCRVGDRRLLLVNCGGRLFAVDEMCSHEDYSLALGCVRDGRIKCSLHGSWFDLADGRALEEPATEPIGTYPVRIEDGRIFIDLD